MITNKKFFIVGLWLLVFPFLGFPTIWKTIFLILSGLVCVFLSVSISLPKKIPKRTLRRKEKTTPVFSESIPIRDIKKEEVVPEVEVEEVFEEEQS